MPPRMATVGAAKAASVFVRRSSYLHASSRAGASTSIRVVPAGNVGDWCRVSVPDWRSYWCDWTLVQRQAFLAGKAVQRRAA